MKAQKQLDAFPASDNQRRRQMGYGSGAVVSLRLTGAVIGQLDAMAERITKNEGRHSWNRITRSRLIQRAIDALLAADKPAKKGKRK